MLNTLRPGDPQQRASYGRADDLRELGVLLLQMMVLPNAPAGALGPLQLRTLVDGAFASSDEDGMKTDGVDVPALRSYLDSDDGLRINGVGGVELLDTGGGERSGWDLLARLLSCQWADRPTAAEALSHPFWDAPISL